MVTAGVGGGGVGRVRLTGAGHPDRPDRPACSSSSGLAGVEYSLKACSWSGVEVSWLALAVGWLRTLAVSPIINKNKINEFKLCGLYFK